MPDELDTRIRSLEAERLRPVPPPPPRSPDVARQLLEEIGSTSKYDPETPGPRASAHPTETIRKDRC